MPGLGPTQLITAVARMSWLDGKKIPTAGEEGEGATAACSLKGLKGFEGMQVTGEAGSMAAAPVHKFWRASGQIEELSKTWRGPVAHGKGAGSAGCIELPFGRF